MLMFVAWLCCVAVAYHIFRKWRSRLAELTKELLQTRGQLDQQARLEEELRQARDEADEANRAKTDFLATMSHEIRTPLNAVLGFSELLVRQQLADPSQRYADFLHASARSLRGLLDDLLDYSKIESGRMVIERRPLDVRELVAQVERMFAPAAVERQIEIFSSVAEDVPTFVIGDEQRLRQILINLVSNALKFTLEGEVEICVSRDLSEAEAGERLLFEVCDTGVGVPAEVQPLLFKPFEQGDQQVGKRFGGTGLGLSICRELVGLMGGAIGLESETGEGATFFFRIPLQEHPTAALSDEDETPAFDAGFAPRYPASILVVDDHEPSRLLLVGALQQLGYAPRQSSSGQEAQADLLRAPCDIILLDIRLPDMDGYALATSIKQGRTDCQIIAVTAYASTRDRDKCLAAGMDDYIPKPIRIRDIKKSLAEACKRKTSQAS